LRIAPDPQDTLQTPDQAGPSPANERSTAGIVAPPPLIYAASLAIGFGLDAVLPSASFPYLVRAVLGWVLLILGLSLMAWFVSALRGGGTPVDPYRPTTAIVTNGPYRVSRNPGYLGMTLTSAGIILLANAPWALVALLAAVLVVDRGVIVREERYLERRFGDEYLRYKAGTRRWI
jgi:protein-S-isoprenylcysteine O-methyltransferase Ste14